MQIEMAQAAGVDLPFVTGSDGRPLLQYSRLLPKGNPIPPSQEEEKEEDSRKLSETSAKLRAERLNILKAQTAASASAATSAAAALATASAAAAQTDEGDEEGFMHAAVSKLSDHLVRSESQESDSDVITDRPDEDERQPAESEARLQQDPRLQAFVRYM